MLKKLAVLMMAAAVMAVPFAAGSAFAAVAGSEHDLTTAAGFTGTWGGQGVCSYCHVPHSAQGARLWAASPLASVPVYGASVVAGLCYTCHDGTAGTNANHQASVYDTSAVNHVLLDSTGVPMTDQAVTGWPWTTAGGSMECSSCHNPHDNDAPTNQFLRDVPYQAGQTAAVAANDATASNSMFCNNCHQDRAKAAYENGAVDSQTGNHPVGAAIVDGAKYGAGTGYVDMVKVPYNEVIDNASPAVLRGHLSGYTAGGVICNTCHVPHDATGSYVLIVTNSAAGTNYNTLCQDCHGTTPSLTSNTDTEAVHPVNNLGTGPGGSTGDGVTANGAITIADWTFSNLLEGSDQATVGTNGEVICMSCHKPHQADGGSPILRDELVSEGSGICDECHSTAPVAGANHPNGAGVTLTNEDGGTWPNNDTLPLFGAGGDELWCESCHAAHDGAATANFLLRITNQYSQICNGCHTDTLSTAARAAAGGSSANPSAYIIAQGYAGNHAVAQGAQMGTHAANRPITKTSFEVALTAASGRVNKYPTEGAANVMVCESCHLAHGADANGGWHGTAGSMDLLYYQNGAGGARTGTDGGSAAYDPTDDTYCSACHAGTTNPVAPDGTHPVQTWDVTRTGGTVNTGVGSFADVQPPTITADYNGGVMTCESCHAPHAAGTGMGSFILEDGTSDAADGGTRPNTRNRDPLCLDCHTY